MIEKVLNHVDCSVDYCNIRYVESMGCIISEKTDFVQVLGLGLADEISLSHAVYLSFEAVASCRPIRLLVDDWRACGIKAWSIRNLLVDADAFDEKSNTCTSQSEQIAVERSDRLFINLL